MLENDDNNLNRPYSTRRTIHSEIEEILIKKLFNVIESIQELPSRELNFKPYDDRLLIQLEGFLDKKFKDKTFNHDKDLLIMDFLEQLKKERERRDILP